MKRPFPFALIALVSLSAAMLPLRVHSTPLPPQLNSPLLLAQLNNPFEEGYQMGYSIGRQQGQLFRQDRATYSPDILGVGSNFENKFQQERDRRAAVGYKAGFLAGFHDGYYDNADGGDRGLERFYEGYEQGYQTGRKDARDCRSDAACPYRPVPTTEWQEEQFNSGYRVGYWQGFEREWGTLH